MRTPTQEKIGLTARTMVQAENVDNKYGDVINVHLFGASPATAANYSTFFNAPVALELIRVAVSFTVKSTSGTLQLERLTGTQAPGAGTAILTTTISTAGTANTLVTRDQRDMSTARVLEQGDRLALIDAGTLTGLTDLVITIYYKPLGRGGYR